MADAPLPPDEDAPRSPDDTLRFHRVRRELEQESDRGAAILGGAYVDNALRKAIQARLKDERFSKGPTLFEMLFDAGNPPLQPFSAKIDLAFAMRLIGSHTRQDLHIIRRIRNDFGHDLDFDNPHKALTFEEHSIKSRCNNLWLPKHFAESTGGDHTAKEISRLKRLEEPRGQYIYSVFISSYLAEATAEAMPVNWPDSLR